MTDNTSLNVGTGGDSIRDIDRAGVKTQVVTLDVGDDLGNEALIVGAVPVNVINPRTYINFFSDEGMGGTNPSSNPFAFSMTAPNNLYGF